MKTKILPLIQIDDHTCLHACLAMMTGTTVQEVIEWFGRPEALHAEDAIIYLAHHGVYLATYFYCEQGIKGDPDLKIEFSERLSDRPMLLTVKSQRFPGKLHSIFWTGTHVLDPSPLRVGPQKIESYEIIEFWPLMVTEKQLERFKED